MPSTVVAAGILAAALVASMGTRVEAQAATESAPNSDPAAVTLADATAVAMGGMKAWNDTHFVAWNFFGRRMHVWDKWSGDIRIDAKTREGDQVLVLMNINTKQGRAWKNAQEVTAQDDLAKLLESGYGWWVNDGYWIFMPYKLGDPGVTLRAKGEMAMTDGRMADVLELTFQSVGLTPQNRYLVYVAKESKLIEQWDFFENADDQKPGFQIPWHGWAKYGQIMLSGDRGEDRKLTDIAVFDALPRDVFTSPAAVDLAALAGAARPK
jgi:hypothetical protein